MVLSIRTRIGVLLFCLFVFSCSSGGAVYLSDLDNVQGAQCERFALGGVIVAENMRTAETFQYLMRYLEENVVLSSEKRDTLAGCLEEWPDQSRILLPEWLPRMLRGESVELIQFIRNFSMRDHGLDDSDIRRLLNNPLFAAALQNAKTIDLSRNNITSDSLKWIDSNGGLEYLNSLNVSYNPLGFVGAKTIAESIYLSQVERLWIDGVELGADGLRILSASERLKGVELLSIRYNSIDEAGLEEFAAKGLTQDLLYLDLSGNLIGYGEGKGFRALANSEMADNLRYLGLARSGIGEVEVEAMTAGREFLNLRTLNLGRNRVDDKALRVIADSGKFRAVSRLSLWHNNIGDDGVSYLVQSPLGTGLEWLDLSVNPRMTASGLETLVESSMAPGLKRLSIAGNGLGRTGIEHISGSGELRNLKRIDLTGNLVVAADVKLLVESENVRSLEELLLGGNFIGDAGAGFLANSTQLQELRCLELRRTGVSKHGVISIIRSRRLARLRYFSIRENELRSDDVEDIREDAQRVGVAIAFDGDMWIDCRASITWWEFDEETFVDHNGPREYLRVEPHGVTHEDSTCSSYHRDPA